jgi:hypothetical protein
MNSYDGKSFPDLSCEKISDCKYSSSCNKVIRFIKRKYDGCIIDSEGDYFKLVEAISPGVRGSLEDDLMNFEKLPSRFLNKKIY